MKDPRLTRRHGHESDAVRLQTDALRRLQGLRRSVTIGWTVDDLIRDHEHSDRRQPFLLTHQQRPRLRDLTNVRGAARRRFQRVDGSLIASKQWFGPKGCPIVSCTNDLRPARIDALRAWRSRTAARCGANGSTARSLKPSASRLRRLVLRRSRRRHPRIRFPPAGRLRCCRSSHSTKATAARVVTIRASAHNATELERETFQTGHDGMQQGWRGTFDQLADYLRQAA